VLLTDLYELTMAHADFELGMPETVVFGLFARRLPAARGLLTAADPEQVIDYLEGSRFTSEDLECLGAQAVQVRGIRDAQGCEDVEIMLRGSLDEFRTQALARRNAGRCFRRRHAAGCFGGCALTGYGQ
jgi:Nicotinate phosphoribosyltransferase (NAPRTase) N-terminal domain